MPCITSLIKVMSFNLHNNSVNDHAHVLHEETDIGR